MRTLLVLDPNKEGFEDSAMALFDEKGVLIKIADVYHGETIDTPLLVQLGFCIKRIYLTDIFGDEVVEDTDSSNELPGHDRFIEGLPKWVAFNQEILNAR